MEYISKQSLLADLNEATPRSYFAFETMVREYPTEDVVPVVHAFWICKSVDDNDNGEYTCSRCGCDEEHSINCEVPYCWHCGAKMDGVIYND